MYANYTAPSRQKPCPQVRFTRWQLHNSSHKGGICHATGVGGKGTLLPSVNLRIQSVRVSPCEKVGHLKAICRSKKAKPPSNQSQQDRQHSVQQVQDQENTYPLFTLQSSGRKSWLVTVEVDEQSLTMEIDMGTSISLVSAATYKRLWPLRKLQEAQVKVCTQMSLLWS